MITFYNYNKTKRKLSKRNEIQIMDISKLLEYNKLIDRLLLDIIIWTY